MPPENGEGSTVLLHKASSPLGETNQLGFTKFPLWSASHLCKRKGVKQVLKYYLRESIRTRFLLVSREMKNPLKVTNNYVLVCNDDEGNYQIALLTREELKFFEADVGQEGVDHMFMGVRTDADEDFKRDLQKDRRAVYAVYHESLVNKVHNMNRFGYRIAKPREVLTQLNEEDLSLLGMAISLANFNQNHAYDSRIGVATKPSIRKRTFKAFGKNHRLYPRVDPVIMCLIQSPKRDAILLVSNRLFRKINYYAPVSGFLELGETIEAAVLREVWEETGVHVTGSKFICSQPWMLSMNAVHPQIMMGFISTAKSLDFEMLDNENRAARWFNRKEVAALLAQGAKVNKPAIGPTPEEQKKERLATAEERKNIFDNTRCQISAPYALSHQLIKHWYENTVTAAGEVD